MHLFETHLPVENTAASQAFYVHTVSLEFAYRARERDIVFLWVGPNKQSMLGLWGPSTTYGSSFHKCHFALAVSLPELLASGKRLAAEGITCQNFMGETTTEPSVIGWMPSAQLYFSDPDGHSVEFITMLDDVPDPDFIGSLSSWQNRARKQNCAL
jgi:lactoylglutathione lyase